MSEDRAGRVSDDEDNWSHCESVVRDHDRTAWLATLFAPAERRPALHALGAFAIDIRSVRTKIREPLAGELRLQWWADAIEGETRGDVAGHPVAAALLESVRRYGLSRAALTGFVETERDDLYAETPATVASFDERADRTEGALVAQRALILTGSDGGVTAEAARHAGRALACVEAIRALGEQRSQVLIPNDILKANKLTAADIKAGRITAGVLKALRLHAAEEIAALRQLRGSLEPAAAPAMLMSNLVEPLLARAARRGFDPFTTRLDLPQWRRQWILWRAAGRNGIR